MAIFGTIATIEKQINSEKFEKVFSFLKSHDLASIFSKISENEKLEMEIFGREIYAIFQIYRTKSEPKMEGHRAYTDVQFIFSGCEKIGYCDLCDISEIPNYDSESDIFFCQTRKISYLELHSGEVAIFFPDDLHSPCLSIDKSVLVKKIVFKVKN